MKLEIKNFRGISSGILPIDKHAFIAGQNGAGKTSVSMALAAAFAGHASPWDGVKAKDAKHLLRDGAKRGHVALQAGEQTVNINYPGGSVSGAVDSKASMAALGIVSVATMKPAEAAAMLAQYMGAEPQLSDLAQAVGEAAAAQVWPVIESDGWDAALARAKEAGSRLKGQWEGITGENFGSAKAKDWRPDGADSYDLSGDLQAKLDDARMQHQKLLTAHAVASERVARALEVTGKAQVSRLWLKEHGIPETMTAAECKAEAQRLSEQLQAATLAEQSAKHMAQWKVLAEVLPATQEELAQAQRNLEKAEAIVSAAKKFLEDLQRPAEQVQTAPCPSCGTHLVVVSRSALAIPEGMLSEAENQARREAIDHAHADLDAACNQRNAIHAEIENLRREVQRMQDAEDNLHTAAAPAQPELDSQALMQRAAVMSEALLHITTLAAFNAEMASSGTDAPTTIAQQDMDDAAHAVSHAEMALSISQRIKNAAKISMNISKNANIVEALQPTGVRQSVLAKALSGFNEKLEKICASARWQTVAVTEGMQITYAGREYGWQLSESEKFRCRVALQLAMAEVDQSALVVIDAADILDSKGRNGILALIKSAGRPVIMTMTMNRKEDVPKLSALGIESFWINQSGEIEPV